MKPNINTGSFFLVLLMVIVLIVLNACSTRVNDISTEPEGPSLKDQPSAIPEGTVIETGVASWYGKDFHGKRTSDGEVYDMDKLTAAHKTLPFHTRLWVENTENNKKVMVRINDRGPFIKDRIIDLSRTAAKLLGIYDLGTTPVRLRVIYVPTDPGLSPPTGTTANPTPVIKQEAIDKEIMPIPVIPKTPVPVPKETKDTKDSKEMKDTKPPENIPVKPVTKAEGHYYLQAGAFGSQKNAERVLKQIKESMPDVAVFFKIELRNGLYKILTEKLDSRDMAEKIKRRLEKLSIDSIIKEE